MAAARWAAVRPHDLVWREWDAHGAVYDIASGGTHVINVLALEILTLLSQRDLDIDELTRELADAMPPELTPADAARQFQQQLNLLEELGLAHPNAAPDSP